MKFLGNPNGFEVSDDKKEIEEDQQQHSEYGKFHELCIYLLQLKPITVL